MRLRARISINDAFVTLGEQSHARSLRSWTFGRRGQAPLLILSLHFLALAAFDESASLDRTIKAARRHRRRRAFLHLFTLNNIARNSLSDVWRDPVRNISALRFPSDRYLLARVLSGVDDRIYDLRRVIQREHARSVTAIVRRVFPPWRVHCPRHDGCHFDVAGQTIQPEFFIQRAIEAEHASLGGGVTSIVRHWHLADD